LGVRANLKLQRLYDSAIYQDIFPDTKISRIGAIGADAIRNRELLEYQNCLGYFRNTTVGGSITGEGLDLGVIDDPIKGRKEANSKTVRDGVWDWFTDDFFTRFSENAGLLCILTRWHIDDPIGRLIQKYPDVKVLSYPAIATNDEKNRKEGEALFPEHKSLDFLLERKSLMDTTSWLSIYQQTPIIVGGELIKGEWFKRYTTLPKLEYKKIFVDTAQKKGKHNDYTVFECWGYADGNIYLIDLVRKKMEAPELRRTANDFWNKHAQSDNGRLREMLIEDKASGTGLIQDIKAHDKIPIKAIQRNTDKLTRVQDVLTYIENGYVFIPENASFVSDFIAECEAFTADDAHDHDDQIDPLCDAIDNMIAKRGVTELRVRRL
ncbi:MAG TPA: phage terminase large subunit, partial [Agitococcus sp.]|nr:phage terminase large subunit [Agitococcus sp.]